MGEMTTREKVEMGSNIFFLIAALQGAYLGFKVSFMAGLFMCVTTISPVVTGIVYWVSLGKVDLARWGYDYYVNTLSHTAIPGIIVLIGFAVICYALLATWFKIITMFARK